MTDRLLKRHVFVFNPKDNGGESLDLTTDFLDNGDGVPDGVHTNQTITLSSYFNCASIRLFGIKITSTILRKLADELEEIENNLTNPVCDVDYQTEKSH